MSVEAVQERSTSPQLGTDAVRLVGTEGAVVSPPSVVVVVELLVVVGLVVVVAHAGVVAPALVCPEVLPALSTAETAYVYEVDAEAPESTIEVVGAGICWRRTPFRNTLYPLRPEPPVSVDAFHATLTWLQLVAEAVTPVGAEGGVVSGAAGVVALATLLYEDVVFRRATARTR